MGRIKELRQKVAEGIATDAEKAELAELQTEAEVELDTVTTKEDETEDELVERLADDLVAKATKKASSISEKVAAKVGAASVTHEPSGFVVDKSLGKVSVEQLEDVKIELPGRKAAGKQVTEVTGKTIHFMHALVNNDVQKLQLLQDNTNAGSYGGGYLVPAEFANMIVEDIRDMVVMRTVGATPINIEVNTLNLPRLDTRPQANWRSEGAVKSTSTAQFSNLTFTPFSLAAIVPMTQELEADASLGVGGSIVNYIGRLMAQALAEKEDKAFFTGSGTGQPKGLTQETITSIAKSSNFADDIINLWHLLPQGYRSRAVWVGNKHTLTIVRQLKDSQNRYLVQNLGDTPFGELLGSPLYEQNDLGAELYLGDFSFYQIVDRQGVTVDVSREATVAGQSAFERNLTFVRVEKRVDGKMTSAQAFRKITGV